MPIGIVMNEQTFHAAGDWEPYGGAPEFDDSALPAAPEPVPEPSRTFHIGEQGYKEMTFTAADFADDGDADRKIENLLRATGNLRPEDYR
jgi:hypothetical protein